jgi:hypothetical protein
VVDPDTQANLSERLQSVAPGTTEDEPNGLADDDEPKTRPKPPSKPTTR